MPERITKLQPTRTLALRGFDSLGASAALHSATDTGFTVSGNFRDPADFAVLVLWDADNFYEHPRLKHLPDLNFDGVTLTFDVRYTNLMPLNCTKYATIDWPYLDAIQGDETRRQIALASYASVVSGSDEPATAVFSFDGENLAAYDRVTLWYQNMAFDFQVPGKLRVEYQFFAYEPGTVHSIAVAGRSYGYTEVAGDGSSDVANHLCAIVNGVEGGGVADPNVVARIGSLPYSVVLERKLDTGTSFSVTASDYNQPETLWHVKLSTVLTSLANQINGVNWATAKMPFGLAATVTGVNLHLATTTGGYDANFLTMYSVSKTTTLRTTQSTAQFAGGTSDAVLRVALDFTQLGLTDVRQMWLTFAPRLANGADYVPQEWEARFMNWTVSGPDSSLRLRVAGPASVRVPSNDPRCTYTGDWVPQEGFFVGNLARGSNHMGESVTIRYYCMSEHDLWVGTSLYGDRGDVSVTIDGTAASDFSAHLATEPSIQTRRRLATAVPAGDHSVTLTSLGHGPFYFDFLEAVVADDVPDPLPARPDVTAALDYSTDHSYKLPPERILWNLDNLGLHGPINQYLGVFWWNQRQETGGVRGQASVTFDATYLPGDALFVKIGGLAIGKTVFPYESGPLIAKHFMYQVNAQYVGVWATVAGSTLTLHARSAAAAYRYQTSAWIDYASGATVAIQVSGTLLIGVQGAWEINPAEIPLLNRGAQDWHLDFYKTCVQRGFVPMTAVSMELVNPPSGFAACYPDGSPVITDTGFGGLHSTHCAFSSAMASYQSALLRELASLAQQAGTVPRFQLGEFTWWYFTNFSASNAAGGMAYYDAETAAAAQTVLGRALCVFQSPDDDPLVNGGSDALFLRNRLRDYASALIASVRAYDATAEFEVLFPYDVNHPTPAGPYQLGGRLNSYVNMPAEWRSKSTCAFDTFKLEALNFGAWSRNLNLVRTSLDYADSLDWPKGSLRSMVPVFRGGYPWNKELQYALDLGFGATSLWAFDHICLYGIDVCPGRAPDRCWRACRGPKTGEHLRKRVGMVPTLLLN